MPCASNGAVTLCYGPPVAIIDAEPSHVAWCFQCREHRMFVLVYEDPKSPWYDPEWRFRCDRCGGLQTDFHGNCTDQYAWPDDALNAMHTMLERPEEPDPEDGPICPHCDVRCVADVELQEGRPTGPGIWVCPECRWCPQWEEGGVADVAIDSQHLEQQPVRDWLVVHYCECGTAALAIGDDYAVICHRCDDHMKEVGQFSRSRGVVVPIHSNLAGTFRLAVEAVDVLGIEADVTQRDQEDAD